MAILNANRQYKLQGQCAKSSGAPRPIADTWIVDEIPELNTIPFAQYKVDGHNYGVIFRVNEMFAFGYNRAQSFRISVGEGNNTYLIGQRQGIPTGEGDDLSARISLLKGRLEFTATHYNNCTPNARFNPAAPVAVRDELSAIFPTTFQQGQDWQTVTTSGYEFELVANITRNWRLALNAATNEIMTEDRVPVRKGFQAEARTLNQPTPLLDAFLQTIPERVPTAGYTKARGNIFTRYTFTQGRLKGFYIGGGANWREPTFRGNAELTGVADAPVTELWSPSYTLVSLLTGYRTRIANRPTTFALNVSNLLDKEYYRSAGVNSGSWGEPRAFRLTLITEF